MGYGLRGVVCGRVQGVGFRAWAAARAGKLRLNGWIRNRNDGRVEFFVEGQKERIGAFVKACERGPLLARVDRLEQSCEMMEPVKDGFVILADK